MGIVKIASDTLLEWVNNIIAEQKVFGVQSKGDKFAFAPLSRAEDLRLDYDVTILPPKKYLQPPREHLLEFNLKGEYKSVFENEPFVLFGVHPYDVVAIKQMDTIFSADNYDVHYMTRRHNATIVACDVEKPSANIFAGYLGTATVRDGFDVLLTKIGDEYLADAKTKKGEHLLMLVPNPKQPTAEDLQKREKVWRENTKILRKQKLKVNPKELPDLLEKSYYHPVWEEKAKLCFSCGSCNIVCPTCYCFDVQDEVNWDMQTGKRTRAWDGCLLRDFATVSGNNNSKRQRTDRYRHRYYRKGKYIADKIAQIACVGCGRCVSSCVPGIANPVEIFNIIYMSNKNIYVPEPATLVRTEAMTAQEIFYEFKLDSDHHLAFEPGQFLEVSLPGIGEAPLSISSSPTYDEGFQLVARKVGSLTNGLSKLKPGDKIGVRGPFGTSFPVDSEMVGKDILFVCGGLGLVSVRSAINYVLDNRDDYGHITILYGYKTPEHRLFKKELLRWSKLSNVTVIETVDTADDNWQGHIGNLASLIPQVKIDAQNTVAIVNGPPVMYRPVITEISNLAIEDDAIFVSLEKRMKCGVGKCGQCQINDVYVCQEGPVFRYSEFKDKMEAN